MAATMDTQLDRFRQTRDYFEFLRQILENSESPEDQLTVTNIKLLKQHYERIIECVEQDKPFLASVYCAAPEIYAAMDIPWYMFMSIPFLAGSAPFVLGDIDSAEAMGLGSDLCTAIRLSAYCVEAELVPIPTAIVGLASPCDGAPMLHQVVSHNKEWRQTPMFIPDPPYHWDERSIEYFADELRRMVAFLEEHFDRKLDMDRLREVVEESNKQYELWQEYCELRRAVPCPHGWNFGGPNCFSMAQIFGPGDPMCTEWFRQLVHLAEDKVRQGKGVIAEEKIRYLWFDIQPQGWCFEFLPWLEQEWGAVLVMDMFGNYPYTMIDTSTEEAMFKGLAKRNLLEAPMIRQATGIADNFAGDIVRIVKDYKMDCVIWPGHMGHKAEGASIGIMRETCREMGVPFLHIGLDLFDRRYTNVDEVKNRISQFFSTIVEDRGAPTGTT